MTIKTITDYPRKAKEIENIWIPLSDGTKLAARMWIPEDAEEKRLMKQNPFLVARKSVLNTMKIDGELALKYLERKKKLEFSLRQELTGENGSPLQVNVISYKDADNNSAQLPTA